jgi:hypothetical protein
MVERRDAELVDVVHDLRIAFGEFKAGSAWHCGAELLRMWFLTFYLRLYEEGRLKRFVTAKAIYH